MAFHEYLGAFIYLFFFLNLILILKAALTK